MTAKAFAAYRAEMWNKPAEALCPECGGTGYVKLGDFKPGHPQFGKIEHCQICNTTRRADWLAAYCGLNDNEMRLGFGDWKSGDWQNEPPEVKAARIKQRLNAVKVMKMAVDAHTGFYTFWGDFGAGKSMAMQIIANELRLKLAETFYSPFASILEHLRSLYGQGEQSSSFWQRLLDVPVLAIDEVTRFNETAWAREKLYILVDTRYRRRSSHLTLFATNDDPRQILSISEDVGYLFSRMRDGQLIELRGDMRGAK